MTWFYKSHSGGEYGPVSPLELLDLIRNGTLLRDSLVKKDDSQWVKVEEVNGLMANAAKPSVAYFCPTCGKQVSKPPTRCQRCELHVDKPTQKLVQHDLEEIDRKTRKAIAKEKSAVKEARRVESSNASSEGFHGGNSGVASSTVASQPKSAEKDGFGTSWLSWLRKKR